MILIADGGSTKTDWRISDGDTVHSFSSKGINPYFNTPEQIIQELRNSGLGHYVNQVSTIHFYGAGLAGKAEKDSLNECFSNFFKTHNISIHDDLLAAARALFGEGSGIVCILGTGSNSCLFVDGAIAEKIPALGYIMGDEGSGAYIGKSFLNALHKKRFPEELRAEIMMKENLSQDVILEKVYRQEHANRYLASLTQVVNRYIHHEEVKSIVVKAFEAFIEKNISKFTDFQDYKIGFAGSISYYYSPLLREVMENNSLSIDKIIKTPIDELLNYHLRKIN